jgi:hypothetical protein
MGYIGRGWGAGAPIADIAVIAGIGKDKGLPLINTGDTDWKTGDAEIGTRD